MKKLLLILAIAVLSSGCSLLNRNADKIEKYCDKAPGACKAADTLCDEKVISEADCANVKEGCALAAQACLAAINASN